MFAFSRRCFGSTHARNARADIAKQQIKTSKCAASLFLFLLCSPQIHVMVRTQIHILQLPLALPAININSGPHF